LNRLLSQADAIDALLPQTQCGQCGHAGCRPYAEAIAAGAAPVNQCPPGGDETIAALALNTTHGLAAPPAVAVIDENTCIGCTLCLPACPVDAIVGARQMMHTVISAECTGCGLCLPPCPVDCITILATGMPRDWTAQQAAAPRLKNRYLAHQQRLAAHSREKRGKKKASDAEARKRTTINRAMARARARLVGNGNK
jgi:Na+-translocating ferredoxin:NAD+ oxidoreductase subunit B